MIDGGSGLSVLEHLGALLPFLVRRIDVLVVTNPTRSRIGSFPEILRRYDVGRVVLPDIASDLPLYTLLLTGIRAQNIPTTITLGARKAATR